MNLLFCYLVPEPSKYINILTDFGFKRIFADESKQSLER